jgi:hypothetical protein
VIQGFCRDESLSLCPRGRHFQRNGAWYICYCFAKREHAERFQQRFGGNLMDPASRPKWRGSARLMDTAAEERHRNGRCTNCAD